MCFVFSGLVILGEDPFALEIQTLRDSPTENDKTTEQIFLRRMYPKVFTCFAMGTETNIKFT